ncbi:hypothetical protein [Nocardioides houyundeii]|nr:hypothetical protein [Nocardioides houyundeii]
MPDLSNHSAVFGSTASLLGPWDVEASTLNVHPDPAPAVTSTAMG